MCKVQLITEGTESDDPSVFGEEAHIVGKSVNGPRGGVVERVNSHENLILLCRRHHKQIDDQVNYYTTEHLKAIKSTHEEWISSFDDAHDKEPSTSARIQQDFPGTFINSNKEIILASLAEAQRNLVSDDDLLRGNALDSLSDIGNHYPEARQRAINMICRAMRADRLGSMQLEAQNFLFDHLCAEGEAFWPTINIDLKGARLVDFYFRGCQVCDASFDGAHFLGDASFVDCDFETITSFQQTHFEKYVSFGRSKFYGGPFFAGSIFRGGASFASTAIEYGEFGDSTFCDDTTFENATFKHEADFRKARFLSYAGFIACRFGDLLFFDGVQAANGIDFYEAEATDGFSHVKLERLAEKYPY